MKSIRFAFGSFLFVALFATASMAQNDRSFVSGDGADVSPCTLMLPCMSFNRAISQTNVGGEVIALNSASYAPFTVTKPVTVEAPAGVHAGITVTSGDGIDIGAAMSEPVVLRGLTINNQGSTGNGILWNPGGGTLHVENCVLNGFTGGSGIEILGPGNILVKDTIASGNLIGIFVFVNAAGAASVAMDRVNLGGNQGPGIELAAYAPGAVINGAIRNSSASGNSGSNGVMVKGSAGGVASLDMESCMVANNGVGVEAAVIGSASAAITLSNCTIDNNTGNGVAIDAGSTICSRGNNTIIRNGTNVSGSLTPIAAQ